LTRADSEYKKTLQTRKSQSFEKPSRATDPSQAIQEIMDRHVKTVKYKTQNAYKYN